MQSPAAKHPNTLTEAIAEYLTLLAQTSTPHLHTAATQALTLFEDMLRQQYKLLPTQITPAQLGAGWFAAYLSHLQATKAVETEHLYSRAFLDFYTHAAIHGWTEADPQALQAYLIQHRRPKQHSIPAPPTDLITTFLARLAAVPVPDPTTASLRDRLRIQRDKAFIPTLADTGLKVSEICDLRRSHYFADESCIRLHPQTTLLLQTQANTALTAYLALRSQIDQKQPYAQADLPLFARHDKRVSDHVLPISRWTAANIINHWLTTLLSPPERAQLHHPDQTISPQTFRHYFVVTTLATTGDIEHTQALARHSDRSTTRRYLHHIPKPTPTDGPEQE